MPQEPPFRAFHHFPENQRDTPENRELFGLCQEGNNIARVQHLLDKGACPLWHNPEEEGSTGFHEACAGGFLLLVRLLWDAVDRSEEDRRAVLLSKSTAAQNTALHFACAAGHAEVARFLLGKNAPVNEPNGYNNTALHLASMAERRSEATVLELLKHGAATTIRNNRGASALHFAVQATTCDLQGPTLDDRMAVLRHLLEEGGNPNAQDDDGTTALHIVAVRSPRRVLQLLVDYGANIHARDGKGRTPKELVQLDHALQTQPPVKKPGSCRGSSRRSVHSRGRGPAELLEMVEILEELEADGVGGGPAATAAFGTVSEEKVSSHK